MAQIRCALLRAAWWSFSIHTCTCHTHTLPSIELMMRVMWPRVARVCLLRVHMDAGYSEAWGRLWKERKKNKKIFEFKIHLDGEKK